MIICRRKLCDVWWWWWWRCYDDDYLNELDLTKREKKNISTVNVLSGKNSAFLIKGSFCANVSFSTVKFVMNHSEKHLHNNERDLEVILRQTCNWGTCVDSGEGCLGKLNFWNSHRPQTTPSTGKQNHFSKPSSTPGNFLDPECNVIHDVRFQIVHEELRASRVYFPYRSSRCQRF